MSNSTAPSQKCSNPDCTVSSSSPEPPKLQQCARCRSVSYCSRECQRASWPRHKRSCRPQNYIIKFQLLPDQIVDPPVERTLSCPAHLPFYVLHMALQTAFGWATTHSFDFAVKDPDYREPTDIMELMQRRMTEGSDPTSPRQFMLRIVDPVQQTMFSGIDRMHEGSRQHPRTVEKKSDKYAIYQFYEDAQYRGKEMVYTYDMGDNWEHNMTMVGRAPPTDDFVCLSGTGHYVAEDAGSGRGWEEVKAAYRATSPTEEQREKRKWFETQASNCDARGLAGDRVNFFDREKINRDLVTMYDRFEAMGNRAAEYQAQMEAVMGERGIRAENVHRMDEQRQ